MDKANVILSGSAVFHGDVNLHFHSHGEPIRKTNHRSDAGSISKTSRLIQGERNIAVIREKPDQDDEAVPDNPGSSNWFENCHEQSYQKHIGDEYSYQITHNPKGLVLLINNEFPGDEKPKPRKGSEIDVDAMEELWRRVGCRVTTIKNVDTENMFNIIRSMVSTIRVVDFFVAIIMSHGVKDDFIIGADRSRIQVKEIVDIVAGSKRLHNKPKLIFIQMCRGKRVEGVDQIEGVGFGADDSSDQIQMTDKERGAHGNHVDSETSNIQNGQDRLFYEEYTKWVNQLLGDVLKGGQILGSAIDDIDTTSEEYICELPDVMLAFASQPDHVAFLRRATGSWLVESITKVFTKYAATLDVVEMMKKVKEEVSEYVAHHPDRKYDKGKETLDVSHTFGQKRLYLFPGCPQQ